MAGRLTQVRARVVQLRPEEVGSESDSHCSARVAASFKADTRREKGNLELLLQMIFC